MDAAGAGRVTVQFVQEEVRQRVLSKKPHEIDMPERKKLKLTVSLPAEEAAPVETQTPKVPDRRQDYAGAKELNRPAQHQHLHPKQEASAVQKTEKEPKVGGVDSIITESSHIGIPDKPENMTEDPMTQEDFSLLVVPASEEDIETDIMEMYFENKKRSGGGPIKCCVKDCQQFIVTFENKADAQEVLQRNHILKNSVLHVSRHQPKMVSTYQPQMSSSLVVVENLQGTTMQDTLILLVENVSELSEEDNDFSVEMVPERNVAVISFAKPVETDQFTQAFNMNHRAKSLKVSARTLEVTKTILVENIPSGTSRDFIVVYFESKKYGGGPVSIANYSPEENSALVTFQDAKDVTTVLKKKHYFSSVPVQVHPFYESLATALYGKERPPIKMPDLIKVSLDCYHWCFLQQNPELLQEIACEMAGYHCEIEWPAKDCTSPEIIAHPSSALLKQKLSLIKTWNEDVSTQLTQILSKQKVVKCEIDALVWEAIRNSIITKDGILIFPDITNKIIALVGTVEAVDIAEKDLISLIESAKRKMEREQLTIEQEVSVISGKYIILSKAGLQERIHLKYPDLKIAYDGSKECVILRGVAAEVFEIKSIIFESVDKMQRKSVDVHAYVLLFLQHVSYEDLSQLLFWKKNINAFYELKGEKVTLVGGTSQDVQQAEREIQKDLTFKCIALEDKEVIKMKEWKELTHNLYKAYNCSDEPIIINELEDQVVIAGYFKAVNDANQKLSAFVDTNTYIQQTIKTKFAVIPMYIEQEKQNHWLNVTKRGVKIHFGLQKNRSLISLEGPRVEVLKGLEILNKLLLSLHSTYVVIDRPGAKAFFKEQAHMYVTNAKQHFNCLIRIQEGKEYDGEEGEDEKINKEKEQQCGEVKLRNGVIVTVYRGDLTRFPADVVVNASNEELKHIGGLADALLKAAGRELQTECNDLVMKHGNVKPGHAVVTSAWNLPCKQVIHAVGPRWSSYEKEKCVKLLKKAVRESLRLAEAYNHRSIAIPAISSGIFGFPLKECAQSIVTAIKETIEESTEYESLKKICLVDFKEDTVQAFSEALNEVFVDRTSLSKVDSRLSPASRTKPPHAESRPGYQGAITAEGLKIFIQKKGIEEATTEVIVNSISRDLQLDQNPLAKALLGRAGGGLQVELTQKGQGQNLTDGCVLQTGGYGLGCSVVLHAILPYWNSKSEEQILRNIVAECLKTTEKQSLGSIAIPAIGTGNLGYPKKLVAKLMFDEVSKFSQKGNPKWLQEVHFVLHPSDTGTIKAFTDEITQSSLPSSKAHPESSQMQGEAFVGKVSSESGVHTLQIGSVTLQVECGDITQETTDAIVNITNESFNLNTGVSKAILEGGGPAMAAECAQLASQPHNNLLCTTAGQLKCRNVLHLVAMADIKAQISKSLKECEQRQFTSVAFPAIGTGKAGRDPKMVANDMIDAIIDYARNTSAPVVKNIKIIIFQAHLLKVFHESMKRNEAEDSKPEEKPPESFFRKITGTVASWFSSGKSAEEVTPKRTLLLEKTIEPATFQICGDSQEKVEVAASWLKDLILKDQNEMNFSDSCIINFEESEYEKLGDLQRRLQIMIKLELGSFPPSLRVCGTTRDVLAASTEIQTLIRNIRDRREEQAKADLFINLVEWQYDDNGQYKAFDSMTNMKIEAAAQHQNLIKITIQNKHYTVDPSQQCAMDAQGAIINLRRVTKAEENLAMALPEEWEDMGQMRVKVVNLNPEVKEYVTVKQIFCQTCNSWTIEKIERIQNPFYWQAYQIKKQEMDAKNGHANNERNLFHGTASTSLTLINNSGFNRSYAGMHAAVYGNGTYFAVDASYSAHDTYSKPDANGRKYMYFARVLVGDYCVGAQGLIVPQPKNTTDPTNLYDSMTDNIQKPTLFVTFNDIQAYPEYLITFKK
ncbi:protein mono-ADP-ribosyltransferase PARP14 isoform X2 [Anolis carolinensis]